MRTDFLSSTEGINKLYYRISRAYFKYTRSSDFQDCAQSVVEKMLERKGRKSTVDQFVIDYLRTQTGRKGRANYANRLRLLKPKRMSDKLCVEKQIEPMPDYLLDKIDDSLDRAMVILIVFYGLTRADCAVIFNLSTDRIMQRVQLTLARLKRLT